MCNSIQLFYAFPAGWCTTKQFIIVNNTTPTSGFIEFIFLVTCFAIKKTHVVQWLGLCTFTAIGRGFILDQGTKILQAMWPDQKKKKKKAAGSICLYVYS